MILHVEDDETGGPAFFWQNPWTGKREKLATLLWPQHPEAATAAVESMVLAMTLSIQHSAVQSALAELEQSS